MSESNAVAAVKDLFGLGEAAKGWAESFAELSPGRKNVSAARAQMKVDELLDERTKTLVSKAKLEE